MVGWGPDQQRAVVDTLTRYGLSRPLANDPVHWQLTNPGQAAPQQEPVRPLPQLTIDYHPPASPPEEEGQPPADGTMLPMVSSMLSAAGYRRDSQELICEFVKTGRVYTYVGVPEDVWRGLVDAGSKGQFMRSNVIPVYPF